MASAEELCNDHPPLHCLLALCSRPALCPRFDFLAWGQPMTDSRFVSLIDEILYGCTLSEVLPRLIYLLRELAELHPANEKLLLQYVQRWRYSRKEEVQ